MARKSQLFSYIERSLHGPVAVREVWQVHTQVTSHFFLQFCVPTIFRNASLLLLFDRNVRCCSRSSVQQPLHASDLMGGANAY